MICIAGKNQIAIDGLRVAVAKKGPASVVICPNKTDCGQSDWQPSLVRYAHELGVRTVTLEDIYDVEDLIFISLEFDRIVRPARFKSRNLYNIHFSKLPAYKGMYTSAWPILTGEEQSGVTLHKIDHGIDTGDVIAQRCFALEGDETARSLYFRYMEEAHLLLAANFDDLLAGNVSHVAQQSQGSTYYGRASIDYANLEIDLRVTAQQLTRQIRAMSFREYQAPRVGDMKIGATTVGTARSVGAAGKILEREPDRIRVSTIDFDVDLYRDDSFDLLDAIGSQGHVPHGQLVSWRHLIEIRSPRGWTPLMMAAFHGNLELCRSLIDVGADLSAANKNGTTPLMYAKDYALKSGDDSILTLLLDSGASLGQRDAFGKTVLDYCESAGSEAASTLARVISNRGSN